MLCLGFGFFIFIASLFFLFSIKILNRLKCWVRVDVVVYDESERYRVVKVKVLFAVVDLREVFGCDSC